MAKLTQDMKDMVAAQQCFIGTVEMLTAHPMLPPNVQKLRGGLSDEALIFTEGTDERLKD